MTTIEINLPDELLHGLTLDRAALSGLAREALLVRLYDLGEVASGRAAELLGISRREFLDLLDQYGVATDHAPNDLEADVRNARAAADHYLQHKPAD